MLQRRRCVVGRQLCVGPHHLEPILFFINFSGAEIDRVLVRGLPSHHVHRLNWVAARDISAAADVLEIISTLLSGSCAVGHFVVVTLAHLRSEVVRDALSLMLVQDWPGLNALVLLMAIVALEIYLGLADPAGLRGSLHQQLWLCIITDQDIGSRTSPWRSGRVVQLLHRLLVASHSRIVRKHIVADVPLSFLISETCRQSWRRLLGCIVKLIQLLVVRRIPQSLLPEAVPLYHTERINLLPGVLFHGG